MDKCSYIICAFISHHFCFEYIYTVVGINDWTVHTLRFIFLEHRQNRHQHQHQQHQQHHCCFFLSISFLFISISSKTGDALFFAVPGNDYLYGATLKRAMRDLNWAKNGLSVNPIQQTTWRFIKMSETYLANWCTRSEEVTPGQKLVFNTMHPG